MGYKFSSALIDYTHLASWTVDRRGETIVCEGQFGDYLPFEPLLALKGIAGKSSRELIYYRSPFALTQENLFS